MAVELSYPIRLLLVLESLHLHYQDLRQLAQQQSGHCSSLRTRIGSRLAEVAVELAVIFELLAFEHVFDALLERGVFEDVDLQLEERFSHDVDLFAGVALDVLGDLAHQQLVDPGLVNGRYFFLVFLGRQVFRATAQQVVFEFVYDVVQKLLAVLLDSALENGSVIGLYSCSQKPWS